MYKIKKNKVKASQIAGFLKKNLYGKDIEIARYSSTSNIKKNSFIFLSEIINIKFLLKENRNKYIKKLSSKNNVLVLCDNSISDYIKCPRIFTKNVRLDFIRVIKKFFLEKKEEEFYTTNELKIKFKKVLFNTNVSIGKGVKIGIGTVIMPNVVIQGKVNIGKNCIIKSNTVIGNQGFSYVYDSGKLIHFPHLGGIKIGNNVWIGSNVCIDRATFDSTIIEDEVKIDDLVQIGHNSLIKKAAQITAGSIICGRAIIGKGCWIAPNSIIENSVLIGDDSLVGTGSVVRNDVKPGLVVAGAPAKFIRKAK